MAEGVAVGGVYASLRGVLGSGEVACIAMAVTQGWMIASGGVTLI